MPKPDTFCTVFDLAAQISIRYLKEQSYLDGYKGRFNLLVWGDGDSAPKKARSLAYALRHP
jgi:hypothetical protein